MTTLLLALVFMAQAPTPAEAVPLTPPDQARADAAYHQPAPAPVDTSYPTPQASPKALPTPQAPGKTLPCPQAPAKVLPAAQAACAVPMTAPAVVAYQAPAVEAYAAPVTYSATARVKVRGGGPFRGLFKVKVRAAGGCATCR